MALEETFCSFHGWEMGMESEGKGMMECRRRTWDPAGKWRRVSGAWVRGPMAREIEIR